MSNDNSDTESNSINSNNPTNNKFKLPMLLCFKCYKCGFMTMLANGDKTDKELKQYYSLIKMRHEFNCKSKNVSGSIT